MNHQLQRRARDVFLQACDATDAEREAVVARCCEGDAELRREVDELLAEIAVDGPLDRALLDDLPPSTDVFEPGAWVAERFEILRLIGRGGMGEVYEARDATLRERVALKTLRAEWSGEAGARERFLREIRLARAVAHPNICRIFDHARHETAEGPIDLVSMKLLDGETLAERIERERPSRGQALSLARSVAQGLDAAHREGVLHLDLKPANIIVVEPEEGEPVPVITDFGIARSIGAETVGATGEVAPLGTPQYMAPEQLRGAKPSAAADLYAFGLVLYELATGQRGFVARNLSEALSEREARTAALVEDLRKQAGRRWANAVEGCLALDAARRPTTAAEAVGIFDGTLSPRNPRRAAWRVAAVAAIVSMAGAPVLIAWRPAPLAPLISWAMHPWADPIPAEIRLAVLPFELNGDDGLPREVADGLAAMTIERLGALDFPGAGLAVIPASESMNVGEVDAGRAASMLGANMVARGSLSGDGERLHAELEVWNAEAGSSGPRRSFEFSASDPIAGREALAAALAEMLDRELPARDAMGDASSQAYLHYLPARGYLVRENDLESVEKAIGEFHRALAEEPELGLTYAGLARGYWRKYELAKDESSAQLAIQAADNAITFAPEKAEAHIALGQVHLATGRHEEAAADFDRALELAPGHSDALIGLGRAYEKAGATEAARAVFQKAIDLRPTLWLGFKWMGLFHYNAGRYAEAIEQYERILELAPNSVHAHLNIGTFKVLAGDEAGAREAWERAVQIQPRAVALGNLANLAFRQQDYQAAIRFGEQAVALDPAPHRLWGGLAAAYYQAQRAEDADAAYQQAVERVRRELAVNPADARATVLLGHYYASMGRTAEALELTRRGLELELGSPELWIEAAETYGQLGRADEAVGLAARAVSSGYPIEEVRRSPNLATLSPDVERAVVGRNGLGP